MTPGQRLYEQGFQEGLRLARDEGRLLSYQDVLLSVMRGRFGSDVTSQVENRVAAASIEEIKAWALRVLSAATLAALFAD